MQIRPLLLPLGLAAAASVYLWALLDIRTSYSTTYNDFFAIPVTIMVIVGSLVEVGRRVLQRHHVPAARDGETGQAQQRNPRVWIALLLAVFLAGFGRVPFILWTAAFLVLAVVVLHPDGPGASRQHGPAFLAIVTASALGVSAVLYVAFTQLGTRI